MTATAVPSICCRGLTKRFGAATAVDGLDLVVRAGTVVGFLGANGAGKSTTIRMLVGLLRPTAGTVEIAGLSASEPAARASVGYMPADPAFYLALSGRANLDLLAALHGRGSPDRAWAAESLSLGAADLSRPVREYSGGMVQKLALVQAVQHRPDLIVLDEPANRLDPLAHRHFEQLVHEIAAAGRTVFLSSHTLSEVEDVCDSVAMIRAGRLLAHHTVSELADLGTRRVHAVFHRPPDRIPEGLVEARLEANTLTGRVPRGQMAPLRALLADDDLVDITIESATLEDAFMALYADDGPP